MPRNHGKLKIQWIAKNAPRNATFRKRSATLLEKAKELSILCQIPVAMVVYGPGDAEPAFWPPNLEEAKGIMRQYLQLPEASKETHRLDNEGFLRQSLKKMGKRFEGYKATTRQLEVNLILNDISLGRRTNLDDLDPELAAAVRKEVDILRNSVYERMNSLISGAAAAIPPPLAPEQAAAVVPPPVALEQAAAIVPSPLAPEQAAVVVPAPLAPEQAAAVLPAPLAPEQAAAAVLVSSQEEALMVAPAPLAVAPQVAPPMDQADAPLFVLPSPPLDPDLLLVPPQEPLMAPRQEPSMVPHTLAAAVGDPLAPTAGVGVDDDGFPRDGSYLLEVADAILDDGSGRAIQATEEDVERLLREHGLESFIKPKPL